MEILEDLVYDTHCNTDRDGDASDIEKERESLTQAHQSIISAILEMLPKELDMWFPCTGNNDERKFYKEGFNQALAEMRERIKEI